MAEQYAPIMLLHPAEPNMPVSVDWLLQRAGLKFKAHCGDTSHLFGILDAPFSVKNLAQSRDAIQTCGGGSRVLTSVDPLPDDKLLGGKGPDAQQIFYLSTLTGDDRHGSLDPKDWTTYVHVYPTYDGGIMVQYWHAFSYNDYQTAPGNLGSFLDQHGGDWDASVQVQLDASLHPEGMWLSRHEHDHPGDFLPRDQVNWSDGTHPIVTVDAGGHAAYASPADFCNYHTFGGQNTGLAIWSRDLTAPDSLFEITCPLGPGPATLSNDPRGGTVWDTSSGGKVTQSVGADLRGVTGSTVGEIANLGEYNPARADCNQQGGGPCVGLAVGAFYPGTNQDFIKYSGVWADPGETSPVGFPPRGPVFQGFDENVQLYRSWYNRASTEAYSQPTGAQQATLVKRFEPWVPIGNSGAGAPAPGLVVTSAGASLCDSGSNDDPGSALAVRCSPPGNGTPCFINDTGGGDPGSPVLCSDDPTSNKVIKVTPTGQNGIQINLLNPDDPIKPAWFLILADGRKCNFLGHGTNTNVLSYDCGGGIGATVPDRSGPSWTVQEGGIQPSPTLSTTRVAVLTAYR